MNHPPPWLWVQEPLIFQGVCKKRTKIQVGMWGASHILPKLKKKHRVYITWPPVTPPHPHSESSVPLQLKALHSSVRRWQRGISTASTARNSYRFFFKATGLLVLGASSWWKWTNLATAWNFQVFQETHDGSMDGTFVDIYQTSTTTHILKHVLFTITHFKQENVRSQFGIGAFTVKINHSCRNMYHSVPWIY